MQPRSFDTYHGIPSHLIYRAKPPTYARSSFHFPLLSIFLSFLDLTLFSFFFLLSFFFRFIILFFVYFLCLSCHEFPFLPFLFSFHLLPSLLFFWSARLALHSFSASIYLGIQKHSPQFETSYIRTKSRRIIRLVFIELVYTLVKHISRSF